MATVVSNVFMNGLRGKIGDDLVVRTMRGKTFIAKPARKPDKKKETAAQRSTRTTFREAADWAQYILLDAEKKAYYKQRAKALKLPNAYTAAVTDYMRKGKIMKTKNQGTITYVVSKPGFTIQQVSAIADETTDAPIPKVVIKQRNDKWLVHYVADVDSSSSLVLIITDNCGNVIRYLV